MSDALEFVEGVVVDGLELLFCFVFVLFYFLLQFLFLFLQLGDRLYFFLEGVELLLVLSLNLVEFVL